VGHIGGEGEKIEAR